jgi:transglutaminase-like putative cysteine protease
MTHSAVFLTALAAVAALQAPASRADAGDPFGNLPQGWNVVSSFTVPDDQTAAIGKKLGGSIRELTNTILSVDGRRLQVNIIRCGSVKDAEAIHKTLLDTKKLPALCLRLGERVVEFVGDDIGLIRQAHYVLGLRPREATYRVSFEVATIDKPDYMECNNLFNLLLQHGYGGTEIDSKIRELSREFEFGNTISLRTGPGSAGKPPTYKFSSPPALQWSKGTDVTSYSFAELLTKAQVPYVSVEAVISTAAFRDTPTDRKGDRTLLGATPLWPTKDERIMEMAKEITAGKTTDEEKVNAILAWMMPGKNLEYSGPMGSRHGVKKAIQQGFGRCWDFADVFVTLCRASGVPARQVAGWLYGESGHVWAEVLIEGKGWRQVDPTAGGGCDTDYIPWFTTEDGEMPIVYVSMPTIEIVTPAEPRE